MSEKLKEKTNRSSISKFNCIFNPGEFVANFNGDDENIEFREIKCHIDFIFHPEIKDDEKKINCYFNLEELTKIIEEGIQSVLGTYYSANVDIEEFYNAEQESIELHKKYQNKKFNVEISNSWTDKRDQLRDERRFRQFTLDLMNEKNDKYEVNLIEKTILYFKIRAIYHKRTLREEITYFLNEIGEKDYENLADILV